MLARHQLLANHNVKEGHVDLFDGESHTLLRLRRVYSFITLTNGSLDALLHHPSLDELDAKVLSKDLQQVKVPAQPTRLRKLVLSLEDDWQARTTEGNGWADSDWSLPKKKKPVTVSVQVLPCPQYAWLKQCTALEELTVSGEAQADFLEAVGEHFSGVKRLHLADTTVIADGSIRRWSRLRHLTFDGVTMDDATLGRVVKTCPELTRSHRLLLAD